MNDFHRNARFKDKVAIITGSARGIGKVYAKGFAREEASVVVADVDYALAKKVAADIIAEGRVAIAVRIDVSNEKQTLRMAKIAYDHFGKIDILVNNAATLFLGVKHKSFDRIPLREWNRVMAVNLSGVWLCCKSVVGYMKAQRYGKIVNISSGTIFTGHGAPIHYIASKGAIISLTRALARELGHYHINVNAVTPGLIETENVLKGLPSKFLQRVAAERCLKMRANPNNLLGTVMFLASEESDFISGQTINVDGGRIML